MKLRYKNFTITSFAGPLAGLISRSIMLFFTSLPTFDALGRQFSLPQNHLSLSTPSSVLKAFTQIALLLHEISQLPLHTTTVFAISSVVATISSMIISNLANMHSLSSLLPILPLATNYQSMQVRLASGAKSRLQYCTLVRNYLSLVTQTDQIHGLVGTIHFHVKVHADNYEGTCVLDKHDSRPYSCTKTASHLPTFIPLSTSSTFFTATSMVLINGDVCCVNEWVLFKPSVRHTGGPSLGCVREVLVPTGATPTQQNPRLGIILLQQSDITACVMPYRMPGVQLSNNFLILGISVSDILHWFVTS